MMQPLYKIFSPKTNGNHPVWIKIGYMQLLERGLSKLHRHFFAKTCKQIQLVMLSRVSLWERLSITLKLILREPLNYSAQKYLHKRYM